MKKLSKNETAIASKLFTLFKSADAHMLILPPEAPLPRLTKGLADLQTIAKRDHQSKHGLLIMAVRLDRNRKSDWLNAIPPTLLNAD